MSEDAVREAGRLIADSGIVDDVRPFSRSKRERSLNGDTSDADDRTEQPRRRRDDAEREEQPRRRKEEREESDDDDGDEPRHERDDYDDEDDADEPTREDGDEGEQDDDEDDADDDRRETLHEVKVNGETLKVPLSELVKGYSRQQDYQQKTRALADRGRNLQASHAEVAKAYQRKLQDVHAVYSGMEKLLLEDLDSQQMRALRASDPQQWMVLREDYNDRLTKVRNVIQGLHNEQEGHRQQFEQQTAANQGQFVEHETAKMVEYMPDWMEGKDGKPSGARRLFGYLQKSGFAETEIFPVIDHRMLQIADKARRYDELMASRKSLPPRTAKPTPKRIPQGKSNVSNQGQRQERQSRNEFTRANDRLKKSGSLQDAGDAINALTRREAKRSRRDFRR